MREYFKNCEHCNNEFKLVRKSSRQRFCSTECSSNAKRRHIKYNNCRNCEISLTKDQRNFCSRSCSAIFYNRSRKKVKKESPTKVIICKGCNSLSKSGRFCSDDCKIIHTRNKRKLRNRRSQRTYQAKKLRVIDPTANSKKIKEIYDNCPPGFEVDHIIPLTKGGKHHEDNLQYLTPLDNKRKGNKLPTEHQVRED